MALVLGGRFGKRRVCDLGHVIENARSAHLDRLGPSAANLFHKLQTAPNAKNLLDRRFALKAKKNELYKVPSACKKGITKSPAKTNMLPKTAFRGPQ